MSVKNQMKSLLYWVRRINSKVSHTNVLSSTVMNLACKIIFVLKEVFTPKFAQQEHIRYINGLLSLVTINFPKKDFNLLNY